MTVVLLITIIIAVHAVVTTGQSCSRRYPALINPPGGDAAAQAAGTWFSYRQNGDVTQNQNIVITSFGPTTEPFTNSSGIGTYMQLTWATPSTGQCVNEYWTGIYANNGMQVGFDAVSTDTINRLKAYSVLYHDYQKIMIGYGCYKPKQDGTCDTPMIWAQTRTRPDQMSASDKANFDSIINTTFQPYCITTQDLPLQTYDTSKPTCPLVNPPTCLSGLINGTALTVPSNTTAVQTTTAGTTTYGSAASAGSSNSGANACIWPLYIPPASTFSYDTNKIGGIAWVYRQLFPLQAASVHPRYFRHVLGNSILPLTNLTGNFEWLEFVQYDNINSTQCSHGSWSGFAATNGQSVGLSFAPVPGGGEIQLPSRVVTLYYDTKYEVYYACTTPSLKPGLCDDPFVIVVGHNDPSQWSQSEKDHVDNDIVTPLFRPFGCSASDIPVQAFPSNKAPCDFIGAPSCLNQYIAGFNDIAPPTVVANGSY
ncbi:uncharacterized protein LOC129583372 [Paramacrobiotus metropolitanus]|uniref:uncharacterized protein LOC129583372 n=1 Tax=Paramacrobiotus metropolitanus TaxID=2943436 RepID=UPI002445A6F7|nr:uncharacterized protein LOC129583372 [Paramacrobiotus metropolitanus]